MLGSKSVYFLQPLSKIKTDRVNINMILTIKDYNQSQINIYLKAFDYFTLNPKDFDGATVAKDLVDIPNLDLDAMLHDYHYSVYKVSSNFISKFKADWIYAKGQEKKGKGQYSSFTRFIGLSIIGLFLVPIRYVINGNISKDNMTLISNDYKILISKK